MIEVFKTDVSDKDHARILVEKIHKTLTHCRANFDLEDCDKILRVKGITGEKEVWQIITLVKSFGNHAEILPDDQFFNGSDFAYGNVSMSSAK
jgi:uncharacterized protein YpbB